MQDGSTARQRQPLSVINDALELLQVGGIVAF